MFRLRGTDAQFIYNETHTSPFVTLKVMIYEPVNSEDIPSYSDFKEFIRRGFSSIGKQGLPLRVVRVPFDLHHPLWVVDPDFSLDDHIHRIALPSPGDKQELSNFISNILSVPLDPNRPPWHIWIIEGLEGGRTAVVAKVHHVMADGLQSLLMISKMHNLPEHSNDSPQALATHQSETIPGKGRLIWGALIDLAKSYTIELPSHYRLMKQKRLATKDIKTKGANAYGPFMAPHTFLNNPGGQYRLFRYENFPLSQCKILAKKLDCTLNTLVMGICSEALRKYFIAVDTLPSIPLVSVMPIGIDRDSGLKKFLDTEIYNNSVAVTFVPIDLNIVDFKERLMAIKQGSKDAVDHTRATDGSRIDNFSDYLPGSFFRLLNFMQAIRQKKKQNPLANLSISNVPGPREPLYSCNGKLKLVELLSAGNLGDAVNLTVTIWSYLDNLCFSCMYRKGAIPDPEKFNQYLVEVYKQLCSDYID